jgi:citrate synthase
MIDPMATDTVTIIDNRTGRRIEVPVEQGGSIRSTELARLGLTSYDPTLANTATCKSAISYVDGERGILRYRGYPVEQLAAHSTFLETAYLIIKGELPTRSHFAMWEHNVTTHSLVHENVKRFIQGFRYDAHPMGILIGTLGALSTFYPDAKRVLDLESRRMQTRRLVGKLPTIAAFAFRHSGGMPFIYPDDDLSYTGNFLSMLFKMTELTYQPDPVLERALDVIFILHAERGQTCSAMVTRAVGSAHADPYAAEAAAAAALSGPKHGAANVDVVHMLREIGTPAKVREFVAGAKRGERTLHGLGHPLFTHHDPRTPIIRRIAHEVFEVTPRNPVVDVARELEKIALEDDDFVAHGLYPNVDFYSGTIYEAMGIPSAMFPVFLAIPRTAGWMAHWAELVLDPEQQKITRPKQIYSGYGERSYVPLDQRSEGGTLETEVHGPI